MGYLQSGETQVRVTDPELRNKCDWGFLWFYAVPGEVVSHSAPKSIPFRRFILEERICLGYERVISRQ